MSAKQSFMRQEALEAPEAVARFLESNQQALTDLGRRLRQMQPPFVMTSARGSSDHAALYFKYLSEILQGVPCASVGASVVSVYGSRLKARNALAITISQSGKSPDIVALQDAAKSAGALTVALVNTEASPAAQNADICLPLHAGTEKSVAATKSFIVSLAAGAAINAHWRDDAEMIDALSRLPAQLDAATKIEWPQFVQMAQRATSLYVMGRGPAFAVAAETALKLKETCAIHAEAYSSAEVMHGPLELVGKDYPVLAYAPEDAAAASVKSSVARITAAGAGALTVGKGGLPHAACANVFLEPITMIQTAYLAIEQTAQALGRNPDQPRLLHKVTETV